MKPAAAGPALDRRPAVVGPGRDEVELVPGVLPELAGVQAPGRSQARPCTLRWPRLHTGEPANGLPGAGRPSVDDPQDLAAERGAVLCRRRGCPHRRSRRRGSRRGRRRGGRRRGCRPWGCRSRITGSGCSPSPSRVIAHDPVVVGGGEVDEHAVVGREPGGHGDPQQARLAPRTDAGHLADPHRRARRPGPAAPSPGPAASPGPIRPAGTPAPTAPGAGWRR